jgi:hypothetical protein
VAVPRDLRPHQHRTRLPDKPAEENPKPPSYEPGLALPRSYVTAVDHLCRCIVILLGDCPVGGQRCSPALLGVAGAPDFFGRRAGLAVRVSVGPCGEVVAGPAASVRASTDTRPCSSRRRSGSGICAMAVSTTDVGSGGVRPGPPGAHQLGHRLPDDEENRLMDSSTRRSCQLAGAVRQITRGGIAPIV